MAISNSDGESANPFEVSFATHLTALEEPGTRSNAYLASARIPNAVSTTRVHGVAVLAEERADWIDFLSIARRAQAGVVEKRREFRKLQMKVANKTTDVAGATESRKSRYEPKIHPDGNSYYHFVKQPGDGDNCIFHTGHAGCR